MSTGTGWSAVATREASSETPPDRRHVALLVLLLLVAVIGGGFYWMKTRGSIITRDSAKSVAWKLCDRLKVIREADWNGPDANVYPGARPPTRFVYSVIGIDVQVARSVDYPTVAVVTLREFERHDDDVDASLYVSHLTATLGRKNNAWHCVKAQKRLVAVTGGVGRAAGEVTDATELIRSALAAIQ